MRKVCRVELFLKEQCSVLFRQSKGGIKTGTIWKQLVYIHSPLLMCILAQIEQIRLLRYEEEYRKRLDDPELEVLEDERRMKEEYMFFPNLNN